MSSTACCRCFLPKGTGTRVCRPTSRKMEVGRRWGNGYTTTNGIHSGFRQPENEPVVAHRAAVVRRKQRHGDRTGAKRQSPRLLALRGLRGRQGRVALEGGNGRGGEVSFVRAETQRAPVEGEADLASAAPSATPLGKLTQKTRLGKGAHVSWRRGGCRVRVIRDPHRAADTVRLRARQARGPRAQRRLARMVAVEPSTLAGGRPAAAIPGAVVPAVRRVAAARLDVERALPVAARRA